MRTLIDHVAALEHDDAVRSLDGRQAMGNHHAGAPG